MVYKKSPLCSLWSAFGHESAESLPACLINFLPESFGALSVSEPSCNIITSYPVASQVRRKTLGIIAFRVFPFPFLQVLTLVSTLDHSKTHDFVCVMCNRANPQFEVRSGLHLQLPFIHTLCMWPRASPSPSVCPASSSIKGVVWPKGPWAFPDSRIGHPLLLAEKVRWKW
jgi:hypothetical protein